MATQADVAEVILHKKLEVEDTSLTTVQFEKAVNETFLVEVKKYESAVNEYPETQESQAESENKQVACSTRVEITDNLVNGKSGTSEGGIFLASPSGSAISSKETGGQEDFQVDKHKPSEVEISETATHLEKGQQFEAVKETAREDVVLEEKNGKADQVKKDSVDEGLKGTEKEIKDSEKDEREGEMEKSQDQLTSKEIPCIPDVTLDHKNVQSVAETYSKEENMDNTSSTDAILLKKEYTEERSFEETKEECVCVDLVTKGKGSEEICSSENKRTVDEENQITHENVGDAAFSTIPLSHEESQNNETGESVRDEIERVIMTDEPGNQEAGIAEKERREDVAGPASSEDAKDLSGQEKDEDPIKNEVKDKDSSVAPFVAKAEEACSQEKDDPEILKESSKIELEYIAKESPIEVTKQNEFLEETTQVKGTESGDITGHENSKQELEISSRKPDEEIHGKDEELHTTEAVVEEAKNTEASSLVAAEVISSVKLIEAEELTDAESRKHEDQPDVDLLPQNETEEEKFQTDFNVVSEEIKSAALRGDATTVTSIKEEGEIKSLEESFKESEDITNLPLTQSDKKTERTEAEFPYNDANNSNATHLLVEQAELKGEKIDEVSKLESHENDQASDQTLAKQEKHAEAKSEGYQITKETFVTSTEEIPPTEIIVKAHENTEEPLKDCGVSSKESLVSQNARENELEEIKKEKKVTDLDGQKFTSSQESEESSTLDDVPTNIEATVSQIHEEEALKPTGEDESHKQEGIAADFNKEQIGERDVVFSTPELIKEGTGKSSEDNVKDVEKLSEAEIPTEIIKEGNINDLPLEKIQEDATHVLKDHECEAEESKEEVLEKLETVGEGENIPCETKNIEKIVDAPLVKQEEAQHEEGKYLDRTDPSIEESKVEIAGEETLKSRGEDEGHTQESTEENVSKEQIIEKDVTFSTPEAVQEATSESSQDNIKAVENLKEEESTAEIIKKDKLDDLSTENTEEYATKTLEERETVAQKSKEKIVEELDTARVGESISCETNENVQSFVDASSMQQDVKDQDQGPIKTPTEGNKIENVEEATLKSKHEDESHRQEAESNKEQTFEDVILSAAESIQEETCKTSQGNVKYAEKLSEEESTVESIPENKQGDGIKKSNVHENEAEKCKDEVVQESDTTEPSESISFETNKDGERIVDASLIKQEEGQQEDSKYQDPNKASIEENKVETPEEEAPKSKDEDESHGQQSMVADFDKGHIVEEDTFSTAESIQEETSKSSQDNINNAEKINEHPAETTNKGNTNNLSAENIQEDAIEVSKEHENEVEKSNEEVVEELETAGLGESIPCKTNKDVESFEDASSVKQDKSQQEEGKYLDPTGASIEKNKPEDEASKSRGDDESHRQESTEADFNKEQIVEREIAFRTPELIQEETSKTSQVDIKDAERIDEESTTERTKVGEMNDLSGENIHEDTIETLKDQENEEAKLKEEVVEELEAAKVNESISCETNKDVESYVDASSVKQEEGRQEEGKYTDPNGASIEENKVEIPEKEELKLKGEDESHRQKCTGQDFNKEHIIGEEVTFSTLESMQHETSESSQDNTKDAEKINEESTIEITKEGDIIDLLQENIQEDAVEALKDHEKEVEKSKEEVVQELETTGPSKSIPFETNEDVEITVDASSVRQEEALTEENKLEDKLSTAVVKNLDDNKVTTTQRGIELASKGEQDQQDVTQEDRPEEKLEDFLNVTPEATETEKSSEMDRELTCVEEERSIQDLNENSETKKEEEKSKNVDTDDSEKEIPKELETAEANESSPCEKNEDAESAIDDSSVKQEEGPKEEVKYIDQVKASTKANKLVETVAAGIVKDENALSKGKDEKQQATQKDKPEEKLDNLISVTPEEIKTETTTENARSITSLEVEGTSQNLEETLETEKSKHTEDTNDSEKEISLELGTETAAAGESIPCKTDEDAECSVDSSSINQEEIQQEEAKHLDQVEDSIEENKFKDMYSTEVVKEDDDGKVEVTEKRIEEASKDEEDQPQATLKDKPGEKLEVTLEETKKEPSSEVSRQITPVEVEGTVQNLDKTTETENGEEKRENIDGTNALEKEIPKELETMGAGESIPCKINKDAGITFDASAVEQEESQKEEVKYIDQVQASIGENKLEETSTTVVKVDDDNKVSNVASNGEEDQQQATQKDKLDEKLENLLHVTTEETEIETSAKNATNITCMGVEVIAQNLEETSEKEKTEHVGSTDDSEKEIPQELETVGTGESIPCKTNEDVEKFVVTLSVTQDGQHEEDKVLDQIDALKEANKVEDSSSTEIRKQDDDSKVEVTKREIEEDQQPAMPKAGPEEKLEGLLQVTPKETEAETSSGEAINITCVKGTGTVQEVEENSEIEKKEENMKNADDANDSKKEVLENTSAGQETREEVSREIVRESSKEVEKEEDKSSRSKVQNEVSDLIGDIEPEALEDSAKPNEELYATTTTEALEKEKLAEEEMQEREVSVHDGTDSGSAGILSEEISVKEAKPNDKEEVKSYGVSVSEKGSENNQVQSKTLLTENLSEEAGLKEGELDNEEQLKSSDVAPEDGVTNIAGSVSKDIVSEKTYLKEVKRDVEENIESSDDALIEKGLESKGDPVSTEILSKETFLEEAKPDDEEQIKNFDAVSEEKGVSSKADVGLESNSVSTESSLDASLVKQEESQQEEVKYIDQARASIEENAGNISCMAVEGISRNLEGTSEKEKIEHVDRNNDSDKEVIEIASVGQETKEEVSKDIVEESSNEVEKKQEEDNSCKSKEQEEVVNLIEEVKPESLEDSAKQDENLHTRTTTEAPEEEKLAEEEIQKKGPAAHDGTDSGSAGILVEETSMKEAILDEEEVRSYDIALEDKGPTSIGGSVSTEIVSEKTLLKEVKTDDEEKIKSSNNALQEKDLESSSDPVSTEIVTKETCPKEAKPDDEEQIKNIDAASEEKGVSSNADVGLESDSVSTESSLDASLVKKEESQQEEVKYIDQAQASIEENKLEETFIAEVVKVDDDNKVSNVTSRGEEDQPQATQKDKGDEKLETLLHMMPEETETGTSTENATNLTCMGVEGIALNLEETSEKEKTEHVDGTNDLEKEIIRELETARTAESTPCKTNEDVERSVVNLLVKQEGQREEDKELDQIDALKEENKVDSSSTEIVKQDDDNKVEGTKREIEEDQQPAMPKDEPEQKLEDLLQVTPKETKAETSSGDAIDITCMEGEGTIQDVKETSEIENKVLETTSAGLETKEEVSRDIVEESSKEVEKKQEEDNGCEFKEQDEVADLIEDIKPESLEDSAKTNEDLCTKTTTEAPEEEELAEEETQKTEPVIHDGTDSGSAGFLVEETSVKEAKPDEEEIRSYDIAPEDKGLTSIACSVSTKIVGEETCMKEVKTDVEEKIKSSNDALEEKGPESSGDPISTEIVLETTSANQETKDLSREIVEESSKEIEKEENKSSESREQNEVEALIEDIKPKSLQESAKPNEELHATTTTKAPKEENLAEEETQEKEPAVHDGSDFGTVGILTEETSIKEAKPDDKEEVRSYEVALEEKGLENNQARSESVFTEDLKGEVKLKEEEPDNEEKLKSCEIAPENKGLTSIVGCVSTENVSEETISKEVKTDDEEKIKSSDDALDEKDLESSGEPISTEIVLKTTSTGLETNEDVERSVVNLLVKQEGQYEKDKELHQVDALKEENKVEDSSSAEVMKHDYENKVEVTKREIEEDQQPAMPKDKPEQKLEDLLQIMPKETGAETSSGDAIASTCVEGEGTIQDVEETSEIEKKEENRKNTDDANEREKEVLENTSADLEIREEVSRDIVEASSKEVEKEEVSGCEFKEQNEVAALIEEIKPKSLEGSAKPNEDLCTKATTKAPEGEKLVEEETQKTEPVVHDGTDSRSEGILVEETSVKEAKPDEEGLTSIAGSISTEIVSEKTCTKEAKTDVEEKIRSSDDALEEKGLESSGDPISTKIVLETTSASQDTKEVSREILEESSKEVEKEEDKTAASREQNEAAALIEDIKPQSLQESAKPNEELYATTMTESQEKLAEEQTQEKEPAVRDSSDSGSAGILAEETSIKDAKPDDKEEVTSYAVSLEEKGSENNQVQPQSVLTENLKGEVELKEEEPHNEDQLKSCDIAPEGEGVTSIAGSVSTENVREEIIPKEVKTDDEKKVKSSDNALEEKDLKSSGEPISTEIVLETRSAGQGTKEEVSRDMVEESSKEVEKEEESSSKSKKQNELAALIEDIKPESLEDGANPNEDPYSKTTTEAPEEEKLAEEETQEKEPAVHYGTDSGSARTLAKETSVKEAKLDDKEELQSYDISLPEKGLENIQVQPESILTENLSEETGLKEGEPEKEEQLKSCDFASEDGLKSIVGSVSTEIVSEKTLLKVVKTDDEEKSKSSDNAFEEKDLGSSDEPMSTEIVSKETCLKEAKPDDEEQIKNSDVASEEKDVSSSTGVGSKSESVSTGISSEEARLKEDEPDDEKQVKGCDIAIEEKGLERSVDVDLQSDFASTKIESDETDSKEAEPKTVEQVKSYDVAPEEKGIEEQSDSVSNETVCAETCVEEDKKDRGDQVNDSVIAPEEKSLTSGLDTGIVSEETAEIANEETRLKEGKENKEEHIQSCDSGLEKGGLVSDADFEGQSASVTAKTVSEETGVKETKRDHDKPVSSSNIVFEARSLESSLDTKIASEETSLEEVKPDDEEQVKDSGPEKESLVTYVDTKVQSDSVSAGKESEERCLEEDQPKNEDKVRSPDIALEEESLVSEETGGKEAESDDKEKVKNSDVAPEEKGVVSNVVSEVQKNENVKSEENEENKVQEVTGECEEKIEQEIKGETPIAGTENKEQDTVAETPLEESSEENLQDSSTVPSTKHEPVITEASERSDETTAMDKTECENANLPITEPTKEEELLQEEDDSKLDSDGTEKKNANEEIQKQRDEELSTPPKITIKDTVLTQVHDSVEKAVENESNKGQATDTEINLKESNPVSIVHEGIYKTRAMDKIECENANLPIIEPTKEEGQLREEDDSKLESHIEKEIVNEEIQKQREEDLSMPPEITGKDAILPEVHEGVEKAVENESSVEQVTDKEIDLKETYTESIVDERVYEGKDSVTTVTEVVKATDADEHISCTNSQAKETSTEENQEFASTAWEDKKINDEGSIKPVDGKIASPEEGKIEEEIKREVDNPCDDNDTTTAREETAVTTTGEAQPVETESEERDLVTVQKVESVMEIEERSFELDQVDQKEAESETIVEESCAVTDIKETELASDAEEVNAAKPIPAVEKLGTDEIKDEIKQASKCKGIKAANEGEISSEQAEKLESSATPLEKEEEWQVKEETEEDIKRAHETVSKDEVNVGVSKEQVQELETSEVVKQTGDSLVEKKAEETKLKEETGEEITEVPIIVPAIADETIEDHTVLVATSKDELRVSPREEQDNEKTSDSSATKTADEGCVQEEEAREIIFSDETQAETKDASITVSEFDSQSIGVITKEDKKITCETITESASEAQLLEQSYVLLPKEEENGITTTAKDIEERTTEETCSKKEVLGGDEIEDIKEASEKVSKENFADIEAHKDQIITDHNEQEHEIAATVKKMDEEETKEKAKLSDDKTLEDSSVVKTVEEGRTSNEVAKIEPQESEGDTRDADSPSVVEASNLNIEKREIASEFVSEKAESPEALTSIEEVEIIENHLKVASTDLRTEEPRCETIIQAEKTTEIETPAKEEPSTEISQEQGALDVKEAHEIIQKNKQPEESLHATRKEQTPKEAEGKESLEKGITTSDKDAPPKLTDPVGEASQGAEPNDTKPKNDNVSVNREISDTEIKKEEYCQGEKGKVGNKTETKPAVISLAELMQSSKEETDQVVEHSTEEREETTKIGREAEKTKTDEERDEEEEEEEDEHEEADHPDAPILVQTSKDTDPKVGRKRSHGLFSGVGSKVKHSISKVKKAITGKSSHSKTQPSTSG